MACPEISCRRDPAALHNRTFAKECRNPYQCSPFPFHVGRRGGPLTSIREQGSGVIQQMAGERSDQESQGRVFQVRPLKIALSEKHRRRAAPAKRAAAGMVNDGVCDVDASVAAEPGAVRQIDIFIDHEEILVESAKFDEHVSPDHAGRSAGAKYLARIVAEARNVPHGIA